MSTAPRFLSQADIRAMRITPSEARSAVLDAFREFANGSDLSPPKTTMPIGTGHSFQSMSATLTSKGIATLKWIGVAPVPEGSSGTGINALIIVSDHESGRPLAVMDGNEITLLRTAALSAAAAQYLAPDMPGTIGMIGCGLQAHAHLDAFVDLFPSLHTLIALSRSTASAEDLAAAGRKHGLVATASDAPAEVLEQCDIVVTMVPASPGIKPFLDARRMKEESFASAVDLGRSWLPDSFAAFDTLATDSLTQSRSPYDVEGDEVTTARFATDLVTLSRHDPVPPRPAGRHLFCFKGFAIADAALAGLAMKKSAGLLHRSQPES